MFNSTNKTKVRDIKKLHKELNDNEFLRIFLINGINVDIRSKEMFEITTKELTIDKLKCFTNDIILYDVLSIEG